MSRTVSQPQSQSQKCGRKEFVCTLGPKAKDVYLVGDFNHWKPGTIRMSRSADGTFRASVELSPGEYQYKFLIDGQWVSDGKAARQVANPYGTMNSVIRV